MRPNNTHTHTHHRLTALCPRLPGWAGTRKVKSIWILLKQQTVSGSGIHWAICKSAPRSREITMPAPHCSVFYRLDALRATKPTVSKHWRHRPNNTVHSKTRSRHKSSTVLPLAVSESATKKHCVDIVAQEMSYLGTWTAWSHNDRWLTTRE